MHIVTIKKARVIHRPIYRRLLSVAALVAFVAAPATRARADSPVTIEIVNNSDAQVYAWTGPHDTLSQCSPQAIAAHDAAQVTCESVGGAFFLGVNDHVTTADPFCLVGENGYNAHPAHCSIQRTGASSFRVVLVGARADEDADFTNVRIDVDNETGDKILAWTAPRGSEMWCSPLPGSRIGPHSQTTANCKSLGGRFQFSVSGASPGDPYCTVSDNGENDHPDRCTLRKLDDLHYEFVVTGAHAY